MFLVALLSFLPLAHADSFTLGVEGNIASNNVMWLAAPRDLWFTGNGGGAISFEWCPGDDPGNGSGLALSAGWNHGGGLTLESDWRTRTEISRTVSFVADPIGLSVGTGILSNNNEIRLLLLTGAGVEFHVTNDLDLSLIGKLGMGAGHDQDHEWYLTNATSAYLRISHDFR